MRKSLLRTALLFIVGTIIIVVVSTPYLRNAVIYLTPNIDDYLIFENKEVIASNPQAWKIAPTYNQVKIPKKYLPEIEKNGTVAWLLVQNGEILFEQYWDGYGAESYSNSFSMAKTVVALLVGIAIDGGNIKSVKQPIGDFLPQYSKGEKAKITIENLLTMSSGLDWNESYINPFAHTTQAYYGNDIASIVSRLDVEQEPGQRFKYLSGNTQLLAYIILASTGKHVSQYASEKLWTPLGAEKNAWWSIDKPNGDEKAYCCFNSNARDFARLGQLILEKGSFNGTPVVSPEYIQKMTTPHQYPQDTTQIYGYQTWIVDYKGEKLPYFRGILGQYIVVIPSKNAVFVRLGHRYDRTKINGHYADFMQYLDCVNEMLTQIN